MAFGSSRSFDVPPERGQTPRFGEAGGAAQPGAAYGEADDGFLPAQYDEPPLSEAQAPARQRWSLAQHVDLALRIAVYFILGLFLLGLFTWGFHFLAPSDWHYLSPSQLDRLQNNLLVAVLSGVVAVTARRFL